MNREPVFLKGKDKDVMLEVISGSFDVPACECTGFEQVTPNTSEGAGEKHIPVMRAEGNRITVQVGSVPHPMSEEHSIGWIQLQTVQGRCYRAYLWHTDSPSVSFTLEEGDAVQSAYAYCNLHGFWKSEE